jgi:hypothetical protein
MLDALNNFLLAVGAVVVTAGGSVAIAFGLFKWLGEAWLRSKFAERLEAFKHEQQKEIEQLQFEISKLLDRTIKLHQKEFEVVPTAWRLLVKSYHSVKSITASLQTYPDIDRMNSAQLDEFLSDCPLKNWQRDELKAASDKNKYYQDAIFWHYINGTKGRCRKSALYLLTNGIFMLPEMKERFQKIEDMGWAAVVEHENNKVYDTIPRQRDALMKFLKEGEALMKELEAIVQQRLWSSTDQLLAKAK